MLHRLFVLNSTISHKVYICLLGSVLRWNRTLLSLSPPLLDALALYNAPFGQGNGSILERIRCRGSEPSLINCSTIIDYPDGVICDHANDIGVRCCK